MKAAAIYTRVSTAEQKQEGVSLDMQEAQCRQRAEQDGAATIEVFSDPGFSGSRAENRPALQRLLSRLADFDMLYVWKLDRLSRSASDYVTISKALQEANVGFVSVTEGVGGSGAAGKLTLLLLAGVGEFFLDLLKENVAAALDQNAVQGKHHGELPFGYRRPRDAGGNIITKGLIEPDPEQAPILQDIFRRYAEGESLSKLAAWLNTLPGRQHRQWSSAALGHILRRRTYIGEILWDGEIYEGMQEALIDWQTWSTVQKRLMENRGVPASARKRSLSPLFRCGVCGSCVRVAWHGPKSEYRRYECHARRTMPKEQRHVPNSLGMPTAHALVWRAVEYFLTDATIDKGYRHQQSRGQNTERRKLEQEREKVEARISYNLQAGGERAAPLHIIKQQNESLMARLEEIDRALAGMDQATDKLAVLRETSPAQIVELLQAQDLEAQRRFVKAFFEVIELHEGFLRFVPSVPEVKPFRVEVPEGHPSRRDEPIAFRLLA